jgi:outer membrane protein assembly factor BamA
MVGLWDGHLDVDLLGQNGFTSFFGLGNGTDGSDANKARFAAELTQITAEPYLSKMTTPFTTLQVGAHVEYTDFDVIENGPVPGTPTSGYTPYDFTDKLYVGLAAEFNVDGTDSLAVTRSGVKWLNRASLNQGVLNSNNFFATLETEVSYFYTINSSGSLSLAFRLGGGSNIGDFEVYHARYISGRHNVRGFAKNRFAGHSNLYNNIELRTSLFDYNAYVTRGEVGALAFFDHGRVWSKVDNSGPWHAGYGGGLWVNPLANFIVSATYAFSPEGPELDIFLKFLF